MALLDVTCECCGKTFQVRPCRVRSGSAKFCSRSCTTKYCLHTNPKPSTVENIILAHLSRRGKPSSATGKTWKHTQEYKDKKRKQMVEYLKKNPLSRIGEKNPNWRGGLTPEHYSRLTRKKWRDIRKYMLSKFDSCGLCGSKSSLIVHHRIPWRYSEDDSESNLMVICRNCRGIAELESIDNACGNAIEKFCRICNPCPQSCQIVECSLYLYRPGNASDESPRKATAGQTPGKNRGVFNFKRKKGMELPLGGIEAQDP